MRRETAEVVKVQDFCWKERLAVMMGLDPAIVVTASDTVRA